MHFEMFRTGSLGLALVAALGVGACSSTSTPPDTSMPPPLDCGAQALAGKVGQPVSGSTAGDLRIGGESVQTTGSVRVISPGQPVTQDFRQDRLNVEVDDSGAMIRAFCG